MGKAGGNPEPDDYLAESQTLTHYRFEGKLYPRLPYGSETFGAPAPVGRRLLHQPDRVGGEEPLRLGPGERPLQNADGVPPRPLTRLGGRPASG